MRVFLAAVPVLLLFGCHSDPLTPPPLPLESAQETEVANALEPRTRLRPGQRVKIAHERPYRPERGL